MLEKEYNGRLIDSEQASEMGYCCYIQWLKSISRYGNIKRTCLFFDLHNGGSLRTIFFTNDHTYYISCRLPSDSCKEGYLGCTARCRKPRPGETWTRGSDLADGKYKEETFRRIVNDIVGYEMKSLQCFK